MTSPQLYFTDRAYTFLVKLYLSFPFTRSPSVMGILVVDRLFFGEIGTLDRGMKIYGGENVELGIRVSC